MDITVKKLTPELAEDYAGFFDVTSHSTGKEEHRCYCIWWSSDDIDKEKFDTVQQRRDLSVKWINDGSIQGYLAYHEGKVVGWCNANTKQDCYGSFCWSRFMGTVHRDPSDVKVKSVYCFCIAPEMQRKGVAGELLKRVCEDAAAEGFDYVEAYPNKAFINTELDFMGPASMYERLGFEPIYEFEQGDGNRKLLMRKNLK